jgi:phage FluMu protein Com
MKDIETNTYRCNHCKKVVERESAKAWVKSYCTETGKVVHLIKMKKS